MEFVISVLLLTIIVLQALQLRATRDLETRLKVVGTNIGKFLPRQGQMAARVATQKGPDLGKARTTKRDTDDLPKRGARISTAVHRKMSNASEPTDD